MTCSTIYFASYCIIKICIFEKLFFIFYVIIKEIPEENNSKNLVEWSGKCIE